MPVALITPEALREKPAGCVDILRGAGFEIRYPQNPQFARGIGGEDEAIAGLQGIDAVIASGELYSEKTLAALPQLRVVARCGVGYDRVDVAAATRHGVPVTITPTANHEAVAELAMAFVFALSKSLVFNDLQVRTGRWPRELLEPIRGKTFGLVGLGRIGRSTALRAAALGMKVLAHEQFPDQAFVAANKIELVDLDALLTRSDYVSIHCPLNPQTQGMFNKTLFDKMKPGSTLINTARGKLVVEKDLLAALQSGHLRGAGLDVFEQEPPAPDNPLFQLDNVVLSPHLAGTDRLSLEAMGCEAAQCIATLYQGGWPAGAVVNDELKANWRWQKA